MKKVWKWLIRIVVAVVLLVVGAVVVAGWMASRYLTPEAVVEAVEKELNARMDVGGLEWKMPAKLVLRDVKLGARDEWAGKSLEGRPEMADAAIEAKEVRVAVGLAGLLRKRVEVKEFVLVEPKVRMVMLEAGGNSLEPLFREPGGDAPPEEGVEEDIKGAGSLNVHSHGILAELEGVALKGAEVELTIEKSGLVLAFSDWDAELDRIEVDPSALETTNTARLRLRGTMTIDSVKGGRYGVLAVDGPAEVKLFDPATGDFAPDVTADLELGEESYLAMSIPAIGQAWEKVGKLAMFGLKMGGLPDKATFGRSRSMAVRYAGERLTMTEPLSIWAGDWELAVLEETWIQMETEEHALGSELVASETLSGKLKGQLDKGFGYLPKEIRPVVVAEIDKLWFRDGRLVAQVVSAGNLSDPDVSVLNKYPDVSDLVKKAGKDAAKEELKDLGGALLKKLLE